MAFSMGSWVSDCRNRGFDDGEMYCFPNSSSVDCTLSLGTPSTRLGHEKFCNYHETRRSSCMSAGFGWNILPSRHSSSLPSTVKGHRGGNNGNPASTGDPLLTRRCANCDTTSTPLWRNGPRGPKSLCNACGIRFKKEERRAGKGGGTAAQGDADSRRALSNPWGQKQKTSTYYPVPSGYGNRYQFLQENDLCGSETGHQFLWQFNVSTDRSSFLHDFTR